MTFIYDFIIRDLHFQMGTRSLAEPFLYLPCDKKFPDYYRTIAAPISLHCIQQKIKDQRYADSGELLADLRRMFDNARAFNEPGSQIVSDSAILESVAQGSLKTHTGGLTLFYPYRRTDKGWTEQASIEYEIFWKKISFISGFFPARKSPLKAKRKSGGNGGVAATASAPAATNGTDATVADLSKSYAYEATAATLNNSHTAKTEILTNGVGPAVAVNSGGYIVVLNKI